MSGIEDRLAAPRVDSAYATVRHSEALLAAIRKRIDELEITHEVAEEIAGLQRGYLTKILGNPPAKRVQLFLACLLIEALGLEIRLYGRPDTIEKFKHRYEKRTLTRKVRAQAGIIELLPDARTSRARLGGLARARLPNLSDINRRANLTRWARHRERQVAAKAS
jgi:hypothetical protein